MTKKDFELIASILNKHAKREFFAETLFDNVIQDFAEKLKQSNKLFDKEKFYKACYK